MQSIAFDKMSIVRQEWKKRMVTIYDIARELKINPCTVSRTFSNPNSVSDKTKSLVMEKAKEMGYRPNMVARQLRRQSSKIIALVSLEPVWCWFIDMMANGIQERANDLGYEVVVLSAGKNYLDRITFCEQMRFSGVIIASTELGDDREYPESIIPVVYVNRGNAPKHVILPNDAGGITQAFEYLMDCGHRKIGFINGPAYSMNARIRFDTYRKLIKKYDLQINEEWFTSLTGWDREEGKASALHILSRKDRPTAIIAGDDLIALGVYDAAHEMGLRIGEDVSVIGYDDDIRIEGTYPALTTIRASLYEMGIQAVEMLTALIEKREWEDRIVMDDSLVVRGSVKQID